MLITPKIEFLPEMANGSKDPMQNISGIKLVVFQLRFWLYGENMEKHSISSTDDPQGKFLFLKMLLLNTNCR